MANHHPITVLRGGTVIAHDGRCHRILRDGDLAYAGEHIVYAGPRRTFAEAHIVPMEGKLVLPGFISAHTNLLAAAGLHPPLIADDSALAELALRWGLARLLRGGITTVAEADSHSSFSGLLRALARGAGIRLYHGAAEEAATAAGQAAIGRASTGTSTVDNMRDDLGHRVLGMRVTGFDPDHARTVRQLADEAQTPLLIDLGNTAFNFHHCLRTHGVTPLEWLAHHRLLRRQTMLCGWRPLAADRGSAYPRDSDIPLILAAGSTLIASPLGDAMEGAWPAAAARLQASGGNVAIGVNGASLDMFEELRAYTLLAKCMLGDHEAGMARDAFCAATTGGAHALGRDDLGRLAAGARADIVVVDMERIRIGPIFDPVRSLIATVDTEMIERVVVGGAVVVDDGALQGWDEASVLQELRLRVALKAHLGAVTIPASA